MTDRAASLPDEEPHYSCTRHYCQEDDPANCWAQDASSNRAARIERVASALYAKRHGMPLSIYFKSDEAMTLREVAASAVDAVDAIPNRVDGTLYPNTGASATNHELTQYADATPNRVANLANVLRSALNEFEKDGQKYQRFSTGGRDTATVMAEYILRNWNPDA